MSLICYELERERDALTHLVHYYKTKWEQAEEEIQELTAQLHFSKASSSILKQALDER